MATFNDILLAPASEVTSNDANRSIFTTPFENRPPVALSSSFESFQQYRTEDDPIPHAAKPLKPHSESAEFPNPWQIVSICLLALTLFIGRPIKMTPASKPFLGTRFWATCGLQLLSWGFQYEQLVWRLEGVWLPRDLGFVDGKEETAVLCVDADIGGMGIVIPTTIIWLFITAQSIGVIKWRKRNCTSTNVLITAIVMAIAFYTDITIQLFLKRLPFADAVTALVFLEVFCNMLSISLATKAHLQNVLFTTLALFVIFASHLLGIIIAATISTHTGDTKPGCVQGFPWWGVFIRGKPAPSVFWAYSAFRTLSFWSGLTTGNLLGISHSLQLAQQTQALNPEPPASPYYHHLEDVEIDSDAVSQLLQPSQSTENIVDNLIALPGFLRTVSGIGAVFVVPFLIAVFFQFFACVTFNAQTVWSTFGQLFAILCTVYAISKDIWDSFADESLIHWAERTSRAVAVWLTKHGRLLDPTEWVVVLVKALYRYVVKGCFVFVAKVRKDFFDPCARKIAEEYPLRLEIIKNSEFCNLSFFRWVRKSCQWIGRKVFRERAPENEGTGGIEL